MGIKKGDEDGVGIDQSGGRGRGFGKWVTVEGGGGEWGKGKKGEKEENERDAIGGRIHGAQRRMVNGNGNGEESGKILGEESVGVGERRGSDSGDKGRERE